MNQNCPFDVAPYDQSGLVKSPAIISLNYTNQDFYSMKTRVRNFILERFGPAGTVLPNTFNDLIESSIAIMEVEIMAFMADTLSFKIDQIANEIFIDTVSEIENAFRLAKLVGFKPQPPIAARSMWVATINNPLLTDLAIPTPLGVDVFSDGTATKVELFQADSNNEPMFDDDILIPAGGTTNKSIIGLEGTTRTEEVTSSGGVGQTIQLANARVIAESVRVQVDGVMWDQVDYFTDSQPRREYRVEFDSQYNGYVIFGNNRAGLIPSPGSRVRIVYRTGGGVVGNIVTGFIETQAQVPVPGLGYSVPVSLRNYTKGEFGYDGDTIEDVRRKLPVWARTQDRCVSGEDYKTMCDQFATPYHGQVGKSTAVLRNHGCAGNIVDIYILAQSGRDGLEAAGNELKVDLTESLNRIKMLTDFVCVRDGVVVPVDVSVDVTLHKFYRKFELEMRENVKNKVANFFALSRWDYGQSLRDTDLIKDLADVKEIDSFDITFVTTDPANSGQTVTARFYEIIRPEDVTVSFVYT